jgi:hypothetical protein
MSKKDVKRGIANCDILSETDDSFVIQRTPFQCKKKEMADDPSRKSPAINPARETWTAKQRGLKGQSTKPI